MTRLKLELELLPRELPSLHFPCPQARLLRPPQGPSPVSGAAPWRPCGRKLHGGAMAAGRDGREHHAPPRDGRELHGGVIAAGRRPSRRLLAHGHGRDPIVFLKSLQGPDGIFEKFADTDMWDPHVS